MIQETSLSAFEEIKKDIGKRQLEVYNAIKQLGEANNLMISRYLNIPINSVCGRTFELREMKLVGVSKISKCLITGRKSIYWKVVNYGNPNEEPKYAFDETDKNKNFGDYLVEINQPDVITKI